jgi:hypothetical protein
VRNSIQTGYWSSEAGNISSLCHSVRVKVISCGWILNSYILRWGSERRSAWRQALIGHSPPVRWDQELNLYKTWNKTEISYGSLPSAASVQIHRRRAGKDMQLLKANGLEEKPDRGSISSFVSWVEIIKKPRNLLPGSRTVWLNALRDGGASKLCFSYTSVTQRSRCIWWNNERITRWL